MLETIAAILIVFWLLGFFASHVTGGLIHVAVILGLILLESGEVFKNAAPIRRATENYIPILS
jgi:hypothetical protein